MHLKLSPDCGFAINCSIQQAMSTGRGDDEQRNPLSPELVEARKATFYGLWPHEGKKGWKCKIKQVRLHGSPPNTPYATYVTADTTLPQMVEAGWCYEPTFESDDTATCPYCSLSLGGWEPSDKPLSDKPPKVPPIPGSLY